jgi:putative sigma-54 modulation protein
MTVAVTINTHDFELSDKVQDMIEKKVNRLDRFMPNISEVRVDLTIERNARNAEDRKVAQLTIHTRGAILRAEERTADMLTSVEAAVDKIQRQIERYKAKHYRGRGNGASLAEAAADYAPELEEEPAEAPPIVRRKRHMLTPMSEAEAIEQMSLLGHEDFFVFLDAEADSVNVLYRRHNGSLGIIETEIA